MKLKGKKLKAQSDSKSEFQFKIGQKLLKKYPNDLIFEEVIIPGEKFILDFFIPSLKLVIECHGQQHCKFIKFFHVTRQRFHQQQERDDRKRQWCKLNEFKLLEIFQ